MFLSELFFFNSNNASRTSLPASFVNPVNFIIPVSAFIIPKYGTFFTLISSLINDFFNSTSLRLMVIFTLLPACPFSNLLTSVVDFPLLLFPSISIIKSPGSKPSFWAG